MPEDFMRILGTLFPAGIAAALAMLLAAAPAEAAQRTFVSGTGANAGTCTRAAPCLTFAFAHGQTDPGGEINCVDAGNFGPVVITKSITIDCADTLGGINVAVNGAIGITGADIIVRLRNLTLNGQGTASVGIDFLGGAALFVDNCTIANFNGGIASEGVGIRFLPPSGVTSELYVLDSIVSSNGRAADGGGIVVQPIGTTTPIGSGSARATIENTRVERNTYGIFANGTTTTGTVTVQIRDSLVAGSRFNGISAYTGGAVTSITMDRSSSLLNGLSVPDTSGLSSSGILAQGTNAFVTLAGVTVMSNKFGLTTAAGGRIFTYGNNQLFNATLDGAPPHAATPGPTVQ
jgi:hypothetical protein